MDSQHWSVAGRLGHLWGKGGESVVLPSSNFSMGQAVSGPNLLMKGPL